MVNFQNEITELYYKVYYHKEDIRILETWLYENSDLEMFFNEEKYLDIISIDFKSKEAKYKLNLIIDKYVDFVTLERYNLLNLLESSRKYNLLNLLESSRKYNLEQGIYLIRLYELYCNGYNFLFDIAIGYGLPCLTASNYPKNFWNELNNSEKKELLSKFRGKLEPLLSKCINWIQEGKIVLLDTKDERNQWNYIDKRSVDEQESEIVQK